MLDLIASWGQFVGPQHTVKEVLDPYWPTLIVAVAAALIATPIAREIAFKLRILDLPDASVKTHPSPTAYLGGLAVLAGFLVAVYVGAHLIVNETGSRASLRVIYLICGGAVVAAVIGLIDDVRDIKPWQKLIGQGVCSLFLVLAGAQPQLKSSFDMLGIALPPLVFPGLEYLIVLFFVLGATNSLNLLDGLDGLCAGVTSIITIGFLVLTIHLATWGSGHMLDPVRIVLGLALVGSVFGFLMFNRHPAVIFLGDSGSIFLGYIIAAMMMLFATKSPRWWLASIVIFGLPILDTATALIRRFLNKRPLFVSDRGHIYDQMIDRGISLQTTVNINYLLAGLYVLLGCAGAVLLRARYALILYIVVAIVSFLVVWRKGYFKMAGLRGAIRAGGDHGDGDA